MDKSAMQSPSVPCPSDTLRKKLQELNTAYGEERVTLTCIKELWEKEWSAFLDSIKLEKMIQKMKNLIESLVQGEGEDAKTGGIAQQNYKQMGSLIKTILLSDLQPLVDNYGDQEVKKNLSEKVCQKTGSKILLHLSFQSLITNIQDQLKLIGEKEITSALTEEFNDDLEMKKMETTDRVQAIHHPHLMEFLKRNNYPEFLTLRDGLMLIEKSRKDGLEKQVKELHEERMKLTQMLLDTAPHEAITPEDRKGKKKIEMGEPSTRFLTTEGAISWEMTQSLTEDHPHLTAFLNRIDDPELFTRRELPMLAEKSRRDCLEKLVKEFHVKRMKLVQRLLNAAVEAITSGS